MKFRLPWPPIHIGTKPRSAFGRAAWLRHGLGLILGLAIPAGLLASPGGEAFNTSTGTLNVDYAGYLSKQDVVYNQPETTPTSGLTVGNGRIGAMVWSANGLTMQFNNVDGSEQAAYAAGLVNLYSSPGMDTGYTTFQQRLSLYNGTLTTSYDSNRTVTIMGEAGSEVMGIHVSDTRAGVTAVTLDLSLWNVSSVNAWDNGSANQTAWETVSTYADSTGVGLSRGQADSNNFGYTLAATVDGASFTSQQVSSNLVRLNITPGASYTIWIACASRLNAPGHNSLAQAKALLSSVTGTYSATLAAYQAWWHNFWAKSFVGYSNSAGDADYLENLYYLATYMIAAGGYGNYPFHFINGVFGAAGDAANWSNAYWYWNQRDVYNSFLASNHPDVMQTFNNMYSRNSAFLQTQTNGRYGLSGIWVPETMDWNGSDNGTIYSTYTDNIYSSGTEAAENMYRQYRYTNNYAYLTGTAYPFMKQVATFYANILAVNGSGKYYMPATVAGKYGDNAHETYWNVSNAITDLASIRALYPHAIAAAQLQGVDAALVTQWQNILNNLSPYPLDPNNSNQYAPCATPIPSTSNDENVTCELAWPYGVVGLDTSDLSFGVSNWNNRPFINDNIWTPDGIQAARLGLGDSAFASMKAIMTRYQNYPNGKSNNTNGVFEYLGVNLSSMNESLMQSYNEKIRVFPALPSDSSLSAKFTLAAQGGFLVSSECENGSIKYVGIDSLYGNPASVANPWNGTQAQVRRASDNAILASGNGATFNFATASNTVYVLEPVAQPLGSYAYEQITAAQNNDGKVMGGSVLGIFNGTAHNGGKYEAESGVLAGTASVSGDSAASGGYEVTNIGTGASVSFTNVIAGNQLQIRYCTESNPGKLDLYINGVLSQAVTFPTTNSWWTTYATVTVSVAIPAGATVTLQYDNGDAGTNLDYIQINTVGTTTPTATPSNTPTATPTPTQVSKATWRINAGGPQYTDGSGNVWSADGNFDVGASSSTTTAISGTSDPALYQTTHWNSTFTYTFAVPAGSYQVTLKFAENYYTTTGQRLQNVSINGTQVLSNFDIVADAGGADKADDKVFNNIAPSGGVIAIQFSGAAGSPDGHALVSALQVVPQAATATPTLTLTAGPSGTPTATLAPGSVRVACVGASITWGYCSSNPATASYPAVLQGLLGAGYVVQNDGYSGAGILKLGQEPYWGSTQMANALGFNPNIVIIDLGANDTKPICWQYNANLEADFTAMINQFKALPSHPTVYLALPCWVYMPNYGITENIVAEYLLPRMIKVANQNGVCMIDMFDALYNQPGYYCTDGVHLNDTGYAYMAQVMANAITNKTACYEPPAGTPTPTPTVTLGASSQNWRVNAGGGAYTDGSGNLWSADECYVGGAANATGAGITGTTDPTLYQTERQGDVVTYAFPVPAWDYKVTVKLAEIDGNTTGQRLQNVYINGNQVLSNFDVYAQAGADKAYDAVYDYVAPNAIGQIFVQLGVTGAGASQICAVQVAPEAATPTITPTFTATPTASPVPTPGSCPQPDAFTESSLQGFWSQADVGGASGSSAVLSGGLAVTTSSGDIGGNADSFHYVFQAASQNVDLRLKINSTAANWNAKSGIMLRDSTGGGAVDFYIAGTYSCCNYESGYRTFIGGNDNATGAGTYTSGANPGYVRVVRSGSTFTSYWSSDNSTWNQVQSVTLAMQPNYLVGICTSIGNGSAGTASYGAFSVTCSGPVATATPGQTSTPTPSITASPSRTASPTVSPSPTPTPTALVQSTWRVNSGGPAYTDTLGHVWSADENYSGGTVNGTANSISGTADPALYQDERWGAYNYTFNVPPGSYQVTLKFAELYWTAVGDRVFNVSINGATVLTNFDIFSEVGEFHSDDKVFDFIAPSSGQIVIQLGPASHDNPTVDAIQIIPEPSTPTPSPSASPSPSRTATPSPTWTASPSRTASPTYTFTASPSRTASPTATPSWTASPAPTKTSTPTATPSWTASPVATATPSWTASPLATKTSTPTNTALPSATASWTASPLATATPSWTASPAATKTSTPTNTPVATATPSWSASPVASKTSTPTSTPVPTATASWTASPLATKTSTPTNTALPSATASWTASPLATATPSWTASPLATKTSTPTNTALPSATASWTASPLATATPSWTASPVASKTSTPTSTPVPTATPSWTASPLATKTSTPTNTALPSATASWTASPLATATPSWTASPVASKTSTPTSTPVPTATPSWTASPLATKTSTPTNTALPSATASWTASPVATKTSTPTNTALPSATASWTASPVATATDTPTMTSTMPTTASPSATASPTPTPLHSPTASPDVTAGAGQGAPVIDKAYGVPNPNPTAISFHLQGYVDTVTVQFYTKAMVQFWSGSSGYEAAGWQRLNLPAAALASAPNGIFYAVLTPYRNGSAGKRAVISLMVLR